MKINVRILATHLLGKYWHYSFVLQFVGFTMSLLKLTNSVMVKVQSNVVLWLYYTRMFFITLSMPIEFIFNKTFSLEVVTCPNRRRGCILEWP